MQGVPLVHGRPMRRTGLRRVMVLLGVVVGAWVACSSPRVGALLAQPFWRSAHAQPAQPTLVPAHRYGATPRMSAADKAEVKDYFEKEGFDRWSRIYSEDAEVNTVQLDIREGHAITVDKVLRWVDDDGTASGGETFADVGCGVGSLALPLA